MIDIIQSSLLVVAFALIIGIYLRLNKLERK